MELLGFSAESKNNDNRSWYQSEHISIMPAYNSPQTKPFTMNKHNCNDIITLFNQLFAHSEQTILVAGGKEPIYLPRDVGDVGSVNRIIFTRDYVASALHEVAHWCIAGEARRRLEDYGYWYKPDGRDCSWQARFETVEIKPQALECIFATAAGLKFRVSVDNLMNHNADDTEFATKVHQQVKVFRHKGLPQRAELFHQKLLGFYNKNNC